MGLASVGVCVVEVYFHNLNNWAAEGCKKEESGNR